MKRKGKMKMVISVQKDQYLKGQNLKEHILKYVAEKNLRTWSLVENDTGESCLTHNRPQWKEKVLLRLEVQDSDIVVAIDWYEGQEPMDNIKGYMMGRFSEALLVHFSQYFTYFSIHLDRY